MAGERTLAGSQTTCTPEVCKTAEVLCEEFKATDTQLAKTFDVTPATISRWKDTQPAFASALERGLARQTKRVVRALYERAVGYKHKAKKILQWQGEVIEAEYV